MSNILIAVKEKFKNLKSLRTILIALLILILISSVALAWYINNIDLWGMEFKTGNIEFETYVYDDGGNRVAGPVSSDEDGASNTAETSSKYMNAPLITIENGEVGTIGTAYIAVRSTGSLGIQYRIAFGIEGRTERSHAFLGGYKYLVTKVTSNVDFTGSDYMDVTDCALPENANIKDEVVTIDKNPVNGTIEEREDWDVYRVDFYLKEKNEEYTDGGINIYFNISATQIDGNFDNMATGGATHYCSTREDIDRVKVEAYPGDIIKLTNNITYYGDLVFNKPISLETNNFTLTVRGNLMYDYVLDNPLQIDAGGVGQLIVECTNEGVGGNFQIKAPIGEVSLIGSNASLGDIVVEKNVIIDATNSYGSAGVNFNEVRIVNEQNARKTILLDSNTRATVSFGTTIGVFQSVAKANNIEIVNNGEIGQINLSGMSQLTDENGYPRNDIIQIYVENNNDIINPILLPKWSVKWDEERSVGNTRIVQSFSGSRTEIDPSCECEFDNDDIERETKDSLVEQIQQGNDSRLRIYYQDLDGKTTSIQSILEEYLKTSAGCSVHEVVQLEIVSVGDKAVTNDDIAFMNSDSMLSLKQLDMQKANMYDRVSDTKHKLPDSAFYGVSKYEELILPQNLIQIGANAFRNSAIENIITVPSGVTVFGNNWFHSGYYVRFAASVPMVEATASQNMNNVRAIFVDEAYIASYKSVYSSYATKIYPVSVMDETKQHFVRNTRNDEWEITYFIGGEETVIGEKVTIDSTVLKITSVYDYAYRHNFTGTKVQFSANVENLGIGNFENNDNITQADLNKLKYVGDYAFADASRLASVTFGDALVTLGERAFYNCAALAHDVNLPDTMQKIGASAFQKTNITFINTGGTTSVDGSAFANCAELLSAELPQVKLVGESGGNRLFYSCSKLVSVKMPSFVKASGELMFANCVSLRELYMATEADGISFGSTPLNGCNLSKIKIYVPEESLAFFQTLQPGGIPAARIYPEGVKMGQELVNGFNIGTYIVSDNGDNTCTLITSNIDYTDTLTIPAAFDGKPITDIYANAFRNQGLTNVTLKLGDNLRSIGDSAFYQQGGLIKVEFGKSLEVIGASAFASCANLVQDVVLPDSMESIGSNAFKQTGILSANTGGTTSVEGGAFASCAALVYAKLPEVTVIAESGKNELFMGCSSLVSVEMPKVWKVYGNDIFRNCTALLEIYMGSDDAEVSLGPIPFGGMSTSKIKLFVPEELVASYKEKSVFNAAQIYPIGKKLGSMAVNGFVVGDYVVLENDEGYTLVTTNLEFTGDVTVPNEYEGKPITEIYANAFRNQSFTDVKLVLGENVKCIGSAAFHGRTGLKSVVMDQVTTVEADAFNGSGIQVLNAPKLTSVGNNAFRNCSALETVSIPKVENITATYVFAGCSNLKSVYFETVMSVNANTFSLDTKLERITINRLINSNGDNMPATMTISEEAPCKIYVPYRALSAYPAIWSGKPVVSFDISATYNGDTYILSDNNGRYALLDFVPSRTTSSLTLPAVVTTSELDNLSIYSIEEGAFASVHETLKALTLSSSIAQLNGAALSECSALENIYVNSANAYFASVNGVLYSKDEKMLVKYPAGRSGSFDMTETAYASTIGVAASAFANAAKLTQIKFPASLLMIDSTAFDGCTQLNTVEFTGNTPPILLGASIFDVAVEDFTMVIPTADDAVVTAYLSAYGFVEYEPYIVIPATYERPAQGFVTSVRIPIVSSSNAHGGDLGLQIAGLAQSYVGCPYVYGGTSPEGFDCSGLVYYVYLQNGIVISRTATEQLDNGHCVTRDEMRPGDVIYFGYGDIATHVGIYIGENSFVHAQNTETGVVISSLSESYYADRFLCVHRIVE